MFEIYPFIEELMNASSTVQKIEIFKKWGLKNCRVYLFDEKNSQFENLDSQIEYGKFKLCGLGDYKKTWIIDNKILNEDTIIPTLCIVNFDLNIFTYIDNVYRGRKVPDQENFIKFLSKLKSLKLTNNISTALIERYTTPLKEEILAKMIESYVYYDSIDFETFQVTSNYVLSEDKYTWMKKIWNDANYLLNNNDSIQNYNAVFCYIAKAFILKNKKEISEEERIKRFKEYCFNELEIFLELEMFILILFLKNDSSVQEIFKKLQIGAKEVLKKVSNTVWDIYHIRLLEQSFLTDCIKDDGIIRLHYFATADSGLGNVLGANPVKMFVYYNGKYITVRNYSWQTLFSKEEQELYFNDTVVESRVKNASNKDFSSAKERIIVELKGILNHENI
jgi:hypothetical protein